MANPSVVIAKKRHQIYWKSHTNIYLCFLVIMDTPYLLQLLWLYFSMWKSLKTLDETKLGWCSDKLLSCPLAAVAALSHPSPPVLFPNLWIKCCLKLCFIKDESSQETAHSNGPFLAVSLCGHFETGRRRQEKAKVKPKNNSKKAQCLTEQKKMWFLLFPTVKGNTSFYIYNSFVFSWMIHQLNIIGCVQEWTNGGGDTAWPWTPAGASPPQNTHNKRECQITPKGITSNTKRGQKSPLTKAPMGYLGKKFMHKGNGDFIATCGIWVFLPLLSVQDIGAFQSCGESHGERKSTC